MKIKRKLFVCCIFFAPLAIFNFFRPSVVIYGSPNRDSKIEVVMDVYDKFYDGDVSIWYVDTLKDSTTRKLLKSNKTMHFKYPLLYDKKGSQNLIFIYEILGLSFGSPVYNFFINARELYFFRIHVYIDNSGHIKAFMQKYLWSKKEKFNLDASYFGTIQ